MKREEKRKCFSSSCTACNVNIEGFDNIIPVVDDPPEIHIRPFQRPETRIHIALRARCRCQKVNQLERHMHAHREFSSTRIIHLQFVEFIFERCGDIDQ